MSKFSRKQIEEVVSRLSEGDLEKYTAELSKIVENYQTHLSQEKNKLKKLIEGNVFQEAYRYYDHIHFLRKKEIFFDELYNRLHNAFEEKSFALSSFLTRYYLTDDYLGSGDILMMTEILKSRRTITDNIFSTVLHAIDSVLAKLGFGPIGVTGAKVDRQIGSIFERVNKAANVKEHNDEKRRGSGRAMTKV